jgi:hypothetical protein
MSNSNNESEITNATDDEIHEGRLTAKLVRLSVMFDF